MVRSARAVAQGEKEAIARRRKDFIMQLLVVFGGHGKLAGETAGWAVG